MATHHHKKLYIFPCGDPNTKLKLRAGNFFVISWQSSVVQGLITLGTIRAKRVQQDSNIIPQAKSVQTQYKQEQSSTQNNKIYVYFNFFFFLILCHLQLTWERLCTLCMFSRLCARPPSPTLSRWGGRGGRGGAQVREAKEPEILGADIWDTKERLRAGRGGGISDTERVCVWWWESWLCGWEKDGRERGGERGEERGCECNWKQIQHMKT